MKASEIAYYSLNLVVKSLCYLVLFHKNSVIITHFKNLTLNFKFQCEKARFLPPFRVVIFEIENLPLKYSFEQKISQGTLGNQLK